MSTEMYSEVAAEKAAEMVREPNDPAAPPRLAVKVSAYTHKSPAQLLKTLAGERIHKAESLELYAIDRTLVDALVTRLERRIAFSLSITDRELYLSIGADNLTGAVVRLDRSA